MKIQNDYLTDVNTDYKTPKTSSGRNICDFIVVHYTGSYKGVQGDIQTCLDPNNKVSWHLTIDRDGNVYQHEDFRKILWHAGKSKWKSEITGKTYNGMNRYSIGIELDNAGILKREGNKFYTYYGQEVPVEDVYQDSTGKFWERYTEKQTQALHEVSKVVKEKYNCVEILGHSDIAPGRKVDPGPALDIEKLIDYVF